ncbi:MAG TPA: hypothetical protein EYQ18_27820 [Candidatus Handelsmanbacteria bacterium]|nr:hypothetical protein [Candidatus Handelsmanbacteria bacterium]
MIQLSTFQSDITPPLGHPLCAGWYPPAKAIADKLSALGLIMVPEGQEPIVLCALDWAELSNGDYDRWREELAEAVGTVAERVAVHCIHAHDTPWPDRDAQDILDQHGCRDVVMAGDWAERVRAAAAGAAAAAMGNLQPCSEVSIGEAKVDRIASNRRVMGDDGKVWAVRWTKTPDPAVRAAPEGLIDPMLKTIGFWHGEKALAMLHYYAVHPTSMDGTGVVTPEFVGLARNRRSQESGVPHIYFTGCGGNITAGKYNDGVVDNRELFTGRIHEAMVAAERDSARQPLNAPRWVAEPVCLPPREDLDEQTLLAAIGAAADSNKVHSKAALMLTYLRRREQPIPFTCLHLTDQVAIAHLPGETFIEYQLHAQAARPDAFVAVAGYGDLGTGYITLASSFAEGGYEPVDAFVSGASEALMRAAIDKILRG